MGKGEQTRQAILTHALGLATRVGFEGLTIGRLAEELHLSKSGLFAHFKAKETLQIQVLEFAAQRFVDEVVRPALRALRGEPRVRELFRRWQAWEKAPGLPGGCPFVTAAAELDDRPGPVRDYLVRRYKDMFDVLVTAARGAVEEGHFRADLDCEQLAHDFYGVMLGYHHAARLMKDPRAASRAAAAFEALLRAAQSPGAPARHSRRGG